MWRRIGDWFLDLPYFVLIGAVFVVLFGGGLVVVHLIGGNPMYFVVAFFSAMAVSGAMR